MVKLFWEGIIIFIIRGILKLLKHYLILGISAVFVGSGLIGVFSGLWQIVRFKFIDGILSILFSVGCVFIGGILLKVFYWKYIKKIIIRFKNLGELNDAVLPKQKARVMEVIESGKKNKWGELVTYFYFELEELWFFETGALIIEKDKNTGIAKFSVFVPKEELKNYIIMEDKFGTFKIGVKIEDEKFDLVIDSDLSKKQPHFIKLIARFKKLYEEINNEYKDCSKDKYDELCRTIENLRNSGFKIGSYNVNLNTLTAEKFSFYENNIGLIGRNKISNEIYLTYCDNIIRSNDVNLSYSVTGLVQSDSRHVVDNTTKTCFDLEGAIVGYCLAGPVGAGLMSQKEDDRMRYKLEQEIKDNRRVILTLNDNNYDLPYSSYGLLKELYPKNEKIKYQSVSV